MIMATEVLDNLDKIINAVYGKEVRQAIYDSIYKCYTEGKVGSIDQTAREQIQETNNTVAEEVQNLRLKCAGRNYVTRAYVSNNKQNIVFENCGDYDVLKYTGGSTIAGGYPLIRMPSGLSLPSGKWRLSGQVYVEYSGATTANIGLYLNNELSTTGRFTIRTLTVNTNEWVDVNEVFDFSKTWTDQVYFIPLVNGGRTLNFKMKNWMLEYGEADDRYSFEPAGADVVTLQHLDYLIAKLKADNNLV